MGDHKMINNNKIEFMSKIGRLPILIEDKNMSFNLSDDRNTLNILRDNTHIYSLSWVTEIDIDIFEEKENRYAKLSVNVSLITSTNKKYLKHISSMFGTLRSHLKNTFTGLSSGHSGEVEVYGTGYNITQDNNNIIFKVGKSHLDKISKHKDIKYELLSNNRLKITGIDKSLVGNLLYKMEKIKYPNVYDMKGVRIIGKKYITKAKKQR